MQQKSLLDIFRQNFGRAESELDQVSADAGEGPHVLMRRWRIHDDRRLARPGQPEVLAKGGVARQQALAGIAPTGLAHELATQHIAFRFHQTEPLPPR